MKLCKDCKWIIPSSHPMCAHPSSVTEEEIDVVTGKIRPGRAMSCEDARLFLAEWGSYCGREGQHWQPADSSVVGFT
jgi:hypothetical protein